MFIFSEPILNYLQYCLRQPNLAAITAKSLHSICNTCRHHMVKHLSGLIEILKVVDMLNLPNDVAIGLLKGMCNGSSVYLFCLLNGLFYTCLRCCCNCC